MSEIKTIELVLSNAESMKFDYEHIKNLWLADISDIIVKGEGDNGITRHSIASRGYIHLSSKGDTMNAYTVIAEENKDKPFKRLSRQFDLILVKLHYENGKEEAIFIKWKGEPRKINPQKFDQS
mgnify:CR=1 FL=1